MNDTITNVKLLGTTADSKNIVTLNSIDEIKLWDIEKEDFTDYLYEIDTNEYEFKLLTKSNEHIIFTSTTKKTIYSLNIENKSFNECISFEDSFDDLVSITADLKTIVLQRNNEILLYETHSGRMFGAYEIEATSFIDAILVPDKKHLILAEKRKVLIWDLKTNHCTKIIDSEIEMENNMAYIWSIQLCEDNNFFMIGGARKLYRYNLQNSTIVNMDTEESRYIHRFISTLQVPNSDYLVIKFGTSPVISPSVKFLLWDGLNMKRIDIFGGKVCWTSQFFVTLSGEYFINYGHNYQKDTPIVDIYKLPNTEAIKSYIGQEKIVDDI